MTDEQVEYIAKALKSISHGDAHGPTGLETVAIALSGHGLNSPIGEGLAQIADAINNLANEISDLRGE
jgi:hypothetical protein